MDFGDILSQWDKQQKEEKLKKTEEKRIQVSHKKANAPTKEEKELQKQGYKTSLEKQIAEQQKKQINPMELWLNRYGTVDKDKLLDESSEYSKMENREYLKKMAAEARIDLHGLTRDEAWEKLEHFVQNCVVRGLKKIEIVHGKGLHSTGSDPVLGQMVKTFIEQNKHLGTSGHNDKNHGGSGVTWVLLK